MQARGKDRDKKPSHWPNVTLMLDKRIRPFPNINPTRSRLAVLYEKLIRRGSCCIINLMWRAAAFNLWPYVRSQYGDSPAFTFSMLPVISPAKRWRERKNTHWLIMLIDYVINTLPTGSSNTMIFFTCFYMFFQTFTRTYTCYSIIIIFNMSYLISKFNSHELFLFFFSFKARIANAISRFKWRK